MAHEIESNIEGSKAFFTATPAWHGLGQVLTDAPSIQAAWQIAYPHSLIECALEAILFDGEGNKHSLPIKKDKAIIRDDGKHLGTVGEDYKLEQPSEVLNFFSPFLESGMLDLEAGGSLRDGTRMWALAKIRGSEVEIVKDDVVRAYLLAATSFDGSLSRIVKFCATRVVCANTLAIARGEKGGLEFKIRHTKNMQEKIDDAQTAIEETLAAHSKSTEAYKALAAKKMSHAEMKTYVHNVFAAELPEEDVSTQLKSKIAEIQALLDTQRGIELVPAIRGTAWQAYNAISEHVTHHASRSDDARLNNQWFNGATQALNNRALEMALVM